RGGGRGGAPLRRDVASGRGGGVPAARLEVRADPAPLASEDGDPHRLGGGRRDGPALRGGRGLPALGPCRLRGTAVLREVHRGLGGPDASRVRRGAGAGAP